MTSLWDFKDWKTRFLGASLLNAFLSAYSPCTRNLCVPCNPHQCFKFVFRLPSDPPDNVFSDVIMDCYIWYPHLCAEN